jgi:hypothetical protein
MHEYQKKGVAGGAFHNGKKTKRLFFAKSEVYSVDSVARG